MTDRADAVPALRSLGLPTVHPAELGEGEPDWRRYWSAVIRHRWWVLLFSSLGLAAGVGAARILKPHYLAQATIWIEVGNDRRGGGGAGPIRSSQLLDAGAWLELLKSYVVLDSVVRERHLYLRFGAPADSTAFASFALAERFRPGQYRLTVDDAGLTVTLAARGGVVLQRTARRDSIGAIVGFRWQPPASALIPGHTIDFTVLTPRDAASSLSADLRSSMDLNGNFMRLELTGTDPVATAAILNAVIQRYVAVAAELKRAKLTELTRILAGQLQASERSLRAAENALETFRVHTVTLPTERSTPVVPGLEATRDPAYTNYFGQKIGLEEVRRDRDAIRRVLSQVYDSTSSLEGLEFVGAVQRSAELSDALKELTTKQAGLRALRYRYTDATPAVQRATTEIDSLVHRTIPRLAAALIGELTAREQTLQGRVQAAGGELRQIPTRAIEEARLRREVTIDENLYTTLQQRYEEARLADASSIPDVRVLDHAMAPEQPIKNARLRVMVLGLLGGVGLGLAGAVLLDRMDPRVQYPDQVTRDMGLPILGALPHLNRRGNGGAVEAPTQVIEALREIRLNLVHAYGTAGPVIVTISSAGSGDGKSFVSSNLALTFADGGHRTLLIDGDLRRGMLHRLLKTARKPGLTDFLVGSTSRDAIIQATAYPGLSFIGSGTRGHTAPELLGTPALVQLLAGLRPSYGVILIDSPPLGAGVDPYVLGTVSGNLLLVIRTGTTDRGLMHAKLEVLERLPVRILGAVLNDVPRGALYYRYYAYLSGYSTETEKDVVRRPLTEVR
jgi:tyrosine-protein kinase Etk/Wzc